MISSFFIYIIIYSSIYIYLDILWLSPSFRNTDASTKRAPHRLSGVADRVMSGVWSTWCFCMKFVKHFGQFSHCEHTDIQETSSGAVLSGKHKYNTRVC